jgi:hypothetical protein
MGADTHHDFAAGYEVILSAAPRTFGALGAAERLLARAGFSIASGSAGGPTAIMFGNYFVAKWKNLTAAERAAVHGIMVGDRRDGPLHIRLTTNCPPEGLAAFLLEASELEGIA